MYDLYFLPTAMRDLQEIAEYIGKHLGNPAAASKLANEIIAAAERTAEHPYSNPAYIPIRPLKHEYRKVLVNSYLMLYTVNEALKTVTIYRVVYARRDYARLLR